MWENETLTQFRNDLLDADLAPVHQVSDPVQALTEWLLCFFQAGHKLQVKNITKKTTENNNNNNKKTTTDGLWLCDSYIRASLRDISSFSTSSISVINLLMNC